jgi:UDP-glucose 4-epimerase
VRRNVLVIGGTGFLGAHVCRRLARSGRLVTVLGRRSASAVELPNAVSYRQCDGNSSKVLDEALEECPDVVDLAYATVPQTSYADPIRDIQENLPRALMLFRSAVRKATRKLVLVSSGGTVYGRVNPVLISERQLTNPVCPYGITKLAIEKYAGLFHSNEGLPVVILRPSTAYGEGQLPYRGQGVISTIMGSLRDGRPITLYGGRGVVRDYIYAQDVASAVERGLDAGVDGVSYNVGTGIGYDLWQLLQAIAKVCEITIEDANIVMAPKRPFDVTWNVLDSSLFLKDTGWQPEMDLVQGLGRTWESMREERT